MKHQIGNDEVEINVGDVVYSPHVYRFGEHTWLQKYTVRHIEPKERFGRPDVLLTVDIESVDSKDRSLTRMIESGAKRWSGQLF